MLNLVYSSLEFAPLVLGSYYLCGFLINLDKDLLN